MSLQVWLPLNGDLTQQGTANTTFSGTPAWKTYGKIGNAALNLQNRITCTTTALNGVQFFSVTFWARIENNPDSTANWMDVIGFTDQTSSGTNGQFRFETGYGNNIYSGIHWHDNATNAIIGGSYTYNTGTEFDKWHHIAVTISDTEVCSYYDGILKSTITTNLNKGHLTGAWWLGESTTRGCIQDVRIYDQVLSAAEVKEISQGLVLHYKLDQSNPNLISSDTFVNAPWATAIAAHEEYEGRLAYRLQCRTLYTNTSSGTVNIFPDITYQENTQYTLSITWRDDYRTDNKNSNLRITFSYTDGSSTNRIQSPANTTQSWVHTKITSNSGKTVSKITASYGNSGYLYITDLKLEVGILDTGMLYTDGSIEDSSGYNNNATLNSTTILNTSEGRYDFSTYFGAYNTPVATLNTPSILSALTNCTITYWAKYDTTKSLLLTGQTTSYYIMASNNNNYYHSNAGTITTYRDGVSGTYKCTANEWHFFALTGVNLSTWTAMKINGYGSGWPLNGYISDLRIYAIALDADAIRQLYEVGAKVDNKQNLHAFELVENNSKIQITKRGQVKCNELEENEQTKFYQTDQIIETNEIIEL